MTQWMASNAERLRRRISWALLAGWVIVAFLFWSHYRAQFHSPAGTPLYGRTAAAAVTLLIGMWLTVKIVGAVFGWIYGFRYKEMDLDRYNRAVVADVKRKENIDRSIRRPR